MTTGLPSKKPASWRRQFAKTWTSYLFILPNVIGVVVFLAYPIVYSFYLSLTKWDFVSPPEFVGLQNYVRLFTQDPLFWTSMKVTILYVLMYVPTGLVAALALALVMNQKIRGIKLVRTAIFMPVVTSTVAVAIVWVWLLSKDYGLINMALQAVGLPSVGWLSNETTALPAIAAVGVWKAMGYNAIILFAAVGSVPRILYEAADIDGGNAWNKFWHITLPLIAPAIVFVTITSVIGAFQVFDQVFIMTGGGPGDATYVYNFYFFRQAFGQLKMGYASAMSYILFLVMFVSTLVQLRFTREVAGAAVQGS
ncbi:MAG: sugar ABC transporter permease [Caldilineaceae bacterium]|nr:sugar ABC transporter permease [Caldilineaceae bacterium]